MGRWDRTEDAAELVAVRTVLVERVTVLDEVVDGESVECHLKAPVRAQHAADAREGHPGARLGLAAGTHRRAPSPGTGAAALGVAGTVDRERIEREARRVGHHQMCRLSGVYDHDSGRLRLGGTFATFGRYGVGYDGG